MTDYFADTSYFIALLTPDDVAHARAAQLARNLRGRLVVSSYVLVELAAYFAKPPFRAHLVSFVEQLRGSANVIVIPPEHSHFQNGWTLYVSHRDKSWSLTDCISFAVMNERGIDQALTTDHHFEQAGFGVLLKV